MPRWLEKLLDSQKMLAWAAKKAGSTRASGLEDMTLSMLRGEHGRQAEELERLVEIGAAVEWANTNKEWNAGFVDYISMGSVDVEIVHIEDLVEAYRNRSDNK